MISIKLINQFTYGSFPFLSIATQVFKVIRPFRGYYCELTLAFCFDF